jgi:glyoxylase-like metal-dependent hydrolase (beta-lactamase superfamily II)
MGERPAVQVTNAVHVLPVRVKSYSGAYSPNVYVIEDRGEAIMVDSGLAGDESVSGRLEYLLRLGDPTLEFIVLTHHHLDHAGGARRLREATGARVLIHPDEKALLRDAAAVPVDGTVADGDVLSAGSLMVRVLHTPGHSAGHIALFLEQGKVLFSGDNVLGLGTTAIAPPPFGDMAAYVRSLETMKALDAALLCPGHGPLVREPNRKIQELIDHRRERDEQVLSLINQGHGRLSELVRVIYPELDLRLERLAQGQILSHLYKLQAEGKVVVRQEGEDYTCAPRGPS